jgi:preprotein translocase subunit SecD
MNRYPAWKYALIAILLLVGLIYSVPNLFGESPAIQISSAKQTVKVDASMLSRVEEILKKESIPNTGLVFEGGSVRARFATNDIQFKAKTVIGKALNPNPDPDEADYVVAPNLVPNTPKFLQALGAKPLTLGLDLRGGVHFLLQVDMQEALTKRFETMVGDVRRELRGKDIRHTGIERRASTIEMKFRDNETREKARKHLADVLPDLALVSTGSGDELKLNATLKPESERRIQEDAVKQNISTLHNRINELGVAEPVIQQQGGDRIVVQLPGVQDVARAKALIGRTATLEVRMVDDSIEARSEVEQGRAPVGLDVFPERGGDKIALKKEIMLTGQNLTDAQAGFDSQTQEAAVHLMLDSKGAAIFREVTRANVGKRMAIVLKERSKGEVVTAPVIRAEIGGGRVQISGKMTTSEANDVALLLRAGSLAAPMTIIEERVVGPSLGADNIKKGIDSTKYGFLAVSAFMIFYYLMFGAISVAALAINLVFLIALLSPISVVMTLPGIAAIALTLGMAIDANVLINERIREELRGGAKPAEAIATGYDKAWATILDSNITTLIAGLALLLFGSGAVKGFAWVHCLGILTSLVSSVFVSRGIVNFIYGRKRKLEAISIGQIWKPDNNTAGSGTSPAAPGTTG